MYKLCSKHMWSSGSLGAHARSLFRHTLEWQFMTFLIGYEAKSNREWISSTPVDYLMYSGYMTLAAHWLEMEVSEGIRGRRGQEPECLRLGGGLGRHASEGEAVNP